MKTYINYRPPVPIEHLPNPPQDRSGIWATLAIIAGAIAIITLWI